MSLEKEPGTRLCRAFQVIMVRTLDFILRCVEAIRLKAREE